MKTAARTVLVVVAVGAALSAQTLSQKRLERLDGYLQDEVNRQHIAGAVALVLQDGKPVYDKAFGWADKEAGRKMATDSIFRIASRGGRAGRGARDAAETRSADGPNGCQQ